MLKFDFLAFKTILRYITIITVSLIAGVIMKDGIAIIFALLILYFSITKNLYRAIELFLIWFFISNFFIGQGYITIELISKYIAKPSFLLFVIFLFFINKIPQRFSHARFVKVWIIFLILTFLSAITQGQSPFVIITISSFFILFLLIQAKGITQDQYFNILNLFIAVAIIQTAVSFLQVSELITAPSKIMVDESGGEFEWAAGLDDVASGTFGAAASHITSWYAALISMFMILMWSLTKNNNYLIILAITFLQFATVDSKIIMGVTILMLCFMLFYILKQKSKFRISPVRYIGIILFMAVGAFVFTKAWNSYYEYYGEKTGGSRSDLNTVYETEAKGSVNLILSNISDWGKIRGYHYVFEDFIENEPIQLIWGYGIQGYEFNTKMGYIESKDTEIMRLNSLTKSRSGLIKQFATSGLVGFTFFIISIFLWYKQNNKKLINNYDLIKSSLLNIFLPFTLLAAFLYSIDTSSISLITFAAIISIYTKLSEYSRKRSNATIATNVVITNHSLY